MAEEGSIEEDFEKMSDQLKEAASDGREAVLERLKWLVGFESAADVATRELGQYLNHLDESMKSARDDAFQDQAETSFNVGEMDDFDEEDLLEDMSMYEIANALDNKSLKSYSKATYPAQEVEDEDAKRRGDGISPEEFEDKYGPVYEEMIAEAERDIKELNGGNVSAVEDVGAQTESQVQDGSVKKDGSELPSGELSKSLVKKGGNPLYLGAMKFLRSFYKEADRLDAIIFREEYVLPTIDSLIKKHQKEGGIPQAKIDRVFDDLRGVKNDEEVAFSVVALGGPTVDINGAFQTRNQLLERFAKSNEKDDQNLASSCRWAIRSLTAQVEKLGQKIKTAKRQGHGKAKGDAQEAASSKKDMERY